jgi:hypothetical protein
MRFISHIADRTKERSSRGSSAEGLARPRRQAVANRQPVIRQMSSAAVCWICSVIHVTGRVPRTRHRGRSVTTPLS